MNESLQSEQMESQEEFREKKRRKRNLSDKLTNNQNKTAMTSGSVRDPRMRPQPEVPTRKFFAPLRREMELERSKEEDNEGEQQGTNRAGRPPPVILTSATNLLQLKKKIKGIVKGSFEFRHKERNQRTDKGNGRLHSHQILLPSEKIILLQLFPEIPETYKGRHHVSAIKHACGKNIRRAG
jgi:hypothetical protein